MGLVFITHFIEQVYRISDRITVLRGGRLVGTHEAGKLSRGQLVAGMLGRESAEGGEEVVARDKQTAGAALRVRGIAKRGVMGRVSLEIAPGEVVGLAGLLGSGRTETAGLVFGVVHAGGGAMYVLLSIAAGIGYGWIYASTRSLAAATLAHAGLNTIHFFLFTYPALRAAA
jgi:simple sugar transport system ATP-binding protein